MQTDQQRRSRTFRVACVIAVLGVASSSACTSARRLPSVKPSGSAAFGGMTAVTIESRDSALAAALLRLRLQRTPEHLAAVAYRYYELEIRDTALEYFARCLAIDPTYAAALDGSARIFRDWGYPALALGSAHRATYFSPQSGAAWNTLGTVLQALKLYGDAGDAYRRALDLEPSATYARSNLCYLALVQGDGDRAKAECAAAISADAGFLPAGNNLALTHAASGDLQRAFEAFAAAGGESVAHYNIGIVRLARRQYAEAVAAFEAAYAADPAFDKAHARARQARRLAARPETPNADFRR